MGDEKAINRILDLIRCGRASNKDFMVLADLFVKKGKEACMSQTVAFTVGYLMFYHRMTHKEASALLQSKGPYVCPNPGFMEVIDTFYSKKTN